MKKFITLLTLIFALFSIAPDADARKFGGKRSIGKTHKTTSQQKQTTEQKSPQTQKKSSKKGLMGGLLGGLLAGGLIAAMMGSGAFEGFQMMDFLIIAGLAFIAFKIFKAMSQAKAQAQQGQRPAYAANQSQFKHQQDDPATAASSAQGFAQDTNQVPFNLPAGFELSSFLEGSRSHYKTLQQAWNDNDLNKIQEYVTNELYNELSKDRRELTSQPQTEVMFLDAELVRAESSSDVAQISVKFTGRYRDESEQLEEDINEVWHLERQLATPDAPWLIVGIEQ